MPDFVKLGLFMPEGVDAAQEAKKAKEMAEESGKHLASTSGMKTNKIELKTDSKRFCRLSHKYTSTHQLELFKTRQKGKIVPSKKAFFIWAWNIATFVNIAT